MLNEKTITILLSVFFVVLTLGFLFHQSPTFAGSFAGHTLGITGGVIMTLTLIYPFRKRVQKKRGKTNPINTHIYYGLIGPSLVVIHSAHKFSSTIGVLCFLSMLVVVVSGIVGKFLFRKVNRTLKQQKSDLEALKRLFAQRSEDAEKCKAYLDIRTEGLSGGQGPDIADDELEEAEGQQMCETLLGLAYSITELEHAVSIFSGTKTLFSRWIRVHYILTTFLFAMVIVHVLTTLYYGLRWLQ